MTPPLILADYILDAWSDSLRKGSVPMESFECSYKAFDTVSEPRTIDIALADELPDTVSARFRLWVSFKRSLVSGPVLHERAAFLAWLAVDRAEGR